MKNSDAVGEKLYLRKSVRGEEERSPLRREDLRFEETTEVRCGEGIEASRRFIEQQNLRLMQKSTEKAQALDGAGRERANLTVKRSAQSKLLREKSHA